MNTYITAKRSNWLLVLLVLVGVTPSCAIRPGLGGAGGTTPEGPAQQRMFLTWIDYLESGREGLRSFLRARESEVGRDLEETIESCQRACARVRVMSAVSKRFLSEVYATGGGSGVLLEGGQLVLTAGHVVDDAAGKRLELILSDGRLQSAHLLDAKFPVLGGADSDWAILQLDEPQPNSPAITAIGTVAQGELVILLGYGGGDTGIDAASRIVTDSASKNDKQQLAPLVMIGRVAQPFPLLLELVAGALPLKGMSGGPIFNLSGDLVGLFVGISMQRDKTGQVQYRILATSLAAIQEPLRARLREQSEEN